MMLCLTIISIKYISKKNAVASKYVYYTNAVRNSRIKPNNIPKDWRVYTFVISGF